MVASSALCLTSYALAAIAAGLTQHAEIERDGTIRTVRAHAIHASEDEQFLRPLLRNLAHSMPKANLYLSDSASQRFPSAFRVLSDLDSVYQGHVHEPFFPHVNLDRAIKAVKASGEPGKAAVYGELQPMSFVQLLDSIDARPGQRYYDLGSGTGKNVIMAALLGFNATGVEIVRQRWQEACNALARARSKGLKRGTQNAADASFMRGSFLDADLSDADVVFADSVLFTPQMMQGIASLAERMKPGTKIITANGLPGASFKHLSSVVAPSTWSEHSRWTVQEVTKNGASLLATGRKIAASTTDAADSAAKCSLSDRVLETSMLDERGRALRPQLCVTVLGLAVLLRVALGW